MKKSNEVNLEDFVVESKDEKYHFGSKVFLLLASMFVIAKLLFGLMTINILPILVFGVALVLYYQTKPLGVIIEDDGGMVEEYHIAPQSVNELLNKTRGNEKIIIDGEVIKIKEISIVQGKYNNFLLREKEKFDLKTNYDSEEMPDLILKTNENKAIAEEKEVEDTKNEVDNNKSKDDKVDENKEELDKE